MYHLWAHVNRFKPYVEEPVTNLHIVNAGSKDAGVTKSDMSRLLTCPECLLVQPTAHRVKLLLITEMCICCRQY